jgi:hypothetical protein
MTFKGRGLSISHNHVVVYLQNPLYIWHWKKTELVQLSKLINSIEHGCFEKTIVALPVKKFPEHYRTQRFSEQLAGH